MIDLNPLLDQIDAEEGLEPPADADTINALVPQFNALFGIEPPEALKQLWQRSNGVWVNGAHIYGTRDFEEGEDGRAVHTLGVLESNERLLEGLHEISSPLRFIGEVDDQLLAYDTDDQKWKLVDSIAWDPDVDEDVHASFEDLVGNVLRRALEL